MTGVKRAINRAQEINTLLKDNNLYGEYIELSDNSTWPHFAMFTRPIKINKTSIRIVYQDPYDKSNYGWTDERYQFADGWNQEDLLWELSMLKRSIKKHLKSNKYS